MLRVQGCASSTDREFSLSNSRAASKGAYPPKKSPWANFSVPIFLASAVVIIVTSHFLLDAFSRAASISFWLTKELTNTYLLAVSEGCSRTDTTAFATVERSVRSVFA